MPTIAEQPRTSHRKGARGIAAKAPAAKGVRKPAAEPATVKRVRELGTKLAVARVEAVMSAAERSGLLREKSGRIGGRVSPKLVKKAKDLTGIKTDTDLIEFALANVALEDRFMEAFKAVRGTVDPELDLGF